MSPAFCAPLLVIFGCGSVKKGIIPSRVKGTMIPTIDIGSQPKDYRCFMQTYPILSEIAILTIKGKSKSYC